MYLLRIAVVLTVAFGPAAARAQDEPELDLGGALRFNYRYATWGGLEEERARGGELALDTFRLDAGGAWLGLRLSAQYRFYAGYHMLHHGWLGYAVPDKAEVRVGVSQAPFGLLPYASHNWFFDLPYYLGFEDDYDLGVAFVWYAGPLDVRAAFFKNDEGSYTGASLDSARYSYDVVLAGPGELAGLTEVRSNTETNEGVLRVAWTLEHGEATETEFGLSAKYGGLQNLATGRMGDRWAAAAHLEATWSRLNVQLEAVRYGFRPALPTGSDPRFVVMGAYDAPYRVAASGWLFVANVAWTIPVNAGPLETVTVYDDFSWLSKTERGYADSQQNVVGALFVLGPVYAYLDAALGRNHPWLGPDYGAALAEGDPDAPWEARLNLNLGWYF